MGEVRWAPRVSMDDIRRLYASDARGMRDGELLREVGWALCARAESVIAVNRAHEERIAVCPDCDGDAPLRGERFLCACGWGMDWKAYHLTYKGKQLTGASIVPFAQDFLGNWNRARGDEDAWMRAIDELLHRFHWEIAGRPSRPVAVNYIDGRMHEVFHMLNDLAHADTPEWEIQKGRFEENVRKYRLIWKGDSESIDAP